MGLLQRLRDPDECGSRSLENQPLYLKINAIFYIFYIIYTNRKKHLQENKNAR